jgi:hypothetical protein
MISFRSFRKKINENSNFDSFLISEMAVAHHVRRTHHANIDEEDLDFLHQFPIEYWAPARQQRYHFLWEELKNLHNHRMDTLKLKKIETEVASGLRKFVETGKMPEELENLFNEKKINKKYKEYWTKRISEKREKAFSARDIQLESERIAHDYAKEITEHLLENDLEKKVEFKLRGHGNEGEVKKFVRRPYLNRLYHKIETTPGEEFNINSGLVDEDGEPLFKSVGSKGKYGLDLRNPETIKGKTDDEKDTYITSGWVLPKGQSVRSNLHDYLKYNAAGIFGKMPGMHGEILPNNIFYKKIDSIDDKFSADARKKDLIKKYREEIRNENLSRPKPYTSSQIEKEARKRANEDLIKEAEQGMLYAEPVPVHQGEPPIPKEERRITVKDTGKKDDDGNPIKTLVYPPIYLPFKKNGNKETPLVKPGFHFRELGTRPKDFDETGEVAEEIKDKLTGHNKNYVTSSEEEYLKSPHNIFGSGDLYNAQQQDSHFLSQANYENEKKYKLVFPEKEKKVGIEWNGKVWAYTPKGDYNVSIVKGILNCLRNSACGGKSSNEQMYLMNNMEDIYQDMFSMMAENLDNPNLYTEKGRTKWVFNKVSLELQKDQGAGTRRKRGKGAKSIEAGEVDTFTKDDDPRARDPRAGKGGSTDLVVDRSQTSEKRGRGEKDLIRLTKTRDEKIEKDLEEIKGTITSEFQKLHISKNQWQNNLKNIANTIAQMKSIKPSIMGARFESELDEELHSHIMEILEKFGQDKKDADKNGFNILRYLKTSSENLADLVDKFLDYDLIRKTTNPNNAEIKATEKDFPEFKMFNEIKPKIDFKNPIEAENLIKKSTLEKDEKERLNIYLNTELDKKEEEAEAEAKENPKTLLIPKMSLGLGRRAGKNILTAPEEKSNQKNPSEDWLKDVKSKDYRTLRDDPISLSHHPDYLRNNTTTGKNDKDKTLGILDDNFRESPYYDSARRHILNSLYKTPIEDEGEDQYEAPPIEDEGEDQYEAPPVTQDKPISKPVANVEPPVANVEPPVAKVEPPVAKVEPPVAKVEPPVAKDKPISNPVAQVEPTRTPWRSKNRHYGTEVTRKNTEDDTDDDIGF